MTSGSSARIPNVSNVFSSKYAKGEPRSLGGTREQERLNYGADLLELISSRFSRGGLGDLLHARYESVLCVQAGFLVAHLGQDVLAVDAFIKLGRMSSFPLNVGCDHIQEPGPGLILGYVWILARTGRDFCIR